MNLTLQVILTGLAAGSVYGLLAVGHTLVYRLTGIVHFALGDLVGLGVFIALFVTAGRGPVTASSASSWRFLAGLAVALVAVAAVGSGSYFAVIHQYLVRGSTLGWVAATVAIAFAIENILAVAGDRVEASFYRTSGGAEVDLVLTWLDGREWAVEVKRTLSPKLERGLRSALADIEPERSFLVYPGSARYRLGEDIEAIDLPGLCAEVAAG